MLSLNFVLGISLFVAASGSVCAAQPIPADSMGLSKTNVFDVPPAKVYQYRGEQPGQNKLLPRAYLNAPPQVPHDVGDFLPITAEVNMCAACHSLPEAWGKPRKAGAPTPIPPSHYADQRNSPGKVTDHLINARYTCNQCHVPQANAQPLVENTFGASKKR